MRFDLHLMLVILKYEKRHTGYWLIGFRIYVALAIFQAYHVLEQEKTNIWNRSFKTGNRTMDFLFRKPRA